jgi:hypothetical protein
MQTRYTQCNIAFRLPSIWTLPRTPRTKLARYEIGLCRRLSLSTSFNSSAWPIIHHATVRASVCDRWPSLAIVRACWVTRHNRLPLRRSTVAGRKCVASTALFRVKSHASPELAWLLFAHGALAAEGERSGPNALLRVLAWHFGAKNIHRECKQDTVQLYEAQHNKNGLAPLSRFMDLGQFGRKKSIYPTPDKETRAKLAVRPGRRRLKKKIAS